MTKICMVASESAGTLLRIYPSSQREEGWSAAGTRGIYDSAARRVLERVRVRRYQPDEEIGRASLLFSLAREDVLTLTREVTKRREGVALARASGGECADAPSAMPLTAAFSFRLKDQILENTACVGLYDGERPTLTAATTGGKIFMFDPYARADEHGADAGGASRVRYLNINKKITAVAAGALGAAHDGRDILFVGTGTDVLAYDVDTNTDVFFRDAPEGASSLRRATANAAENVPPLLLVGGNCSLQGLDATGEEAFWTVASDVVTSLGVFADGTIAVGTEDGAVRACVVAADGSERVAFEVREADAVTHIVPHDAHRGESWKEKNGPEDGRLFAFASRDGSIGARDGATLLWREKRGAAKRATCAAAFDLTGDGSPEIVVGFADGTMEVRVFRTGEVLFEDAFDAPLAAIVVAETKKQRLESKSNAAGDLLACAADGEVRGYRAKGSGEGAVVPALGFGADASKGKGKEQGVVEPSVTASGRAYGFDGADADEAPAFLPSAKAPEKKKKSSKLGSLLGLKKLSVSEEDAERAEAFGSASGVPNSPLRASAAVSRETLEALNKRKQALRVELASYEKSSAALRRAENGEGGGTALAGLIPPDTAVTSSLEMDASLGHGQLVLSTNNDTVVKGVVLRGAGAFEGPEESRYFRFDEKNARRDARVPILPPGDDACDVAVHVLVAASGASPTYHVFDLEFRIPKFWGWVPLRVDQVTRDDIPAGSVSFAAAAGSVDVARWLDDTFRCDAAKAVSDDKSDVRCAFLCLKDGSRVVFEQLSTSGTACVRADTMERAGTFVDAMCVGLGIENLDSEADFPAEMDLLRETLRVVDERNALRSKLAAETADTSNAVKALIVHAEDSRILRDFPGATAAYGDLFDANRELMVEHSKRAENHAELLKSLKHVNQVIQRASRLRYGAGAARVVKACRKAVKENKTQALFRIVAFGGADKGG